MIRVPNKRARWWMALSVGVLTMAGAGCDESSSSTSWDPNRRLFFGRVPVTLEVSDPVPSDTVRVAVFTEQTEVLLTSGDEIRTVRDAQLRISPGEDRRMRVRLLDRTGAIDETEFMGTVEVAPYVETELESEPGEEFEAHLPWISEFEDGPDALVLVAWCDDDGDGMLDLGLGTTSEVARAFALTRDARTLTVTRFERTFAPGDETDDHGWEAQGVDELGWMPVDATWPEPWTATIDGRTEASLD